MAGKHVFTPLRIASVVATLGLLGGSLGWASSHGMQGKRSAGQQQQRMERQASGSGQGDISVLREQTPRTIDEYAAYVQNRLQIEAMKLQQQGIAELKLTIDKNGSVQQTEILEVEGSPMLREQVRSLVNQVTPLPPLPGNTEALEVTMTLAFNYPGENLYDRFGQIRRPM
jgi:TonB family protein